MGRRALGIVTILLAACAERGRETPPRPDASTTPASSTAVSQVTLVSPEPVASLAPRMAAPVPVPTQAQAEWVWKPYRGDHFVVLFPGDPKLTVLPAEDDRVGYTEAKVDVPGGQVSFAAGFTDHTAEEVAKPEEFLDGRVNAPRRGLTDVLHKRAIALPGGQPGRVLILRRDISGTPLRIYSRLFLVKRRLYSLIVSTLDAGGVGEDVVKKFMESFRLL